MRFWGTFCAISMLVLTLPLAHADDEEDIVIVNDEPEHVQGKAAKIKYPDKLTLDWSCPQTKGSKATIPETVEFKLDAKRGLADTSKFDAALKKLLTTEPGLDFFTCAQRLILQNKKALGAYCKKAADKDPASRCGDALATIYNSISKYGSEAYAKGAVAYIEPGAKLLKKPSKKESSALAKLLGPPGCGDGADERAVTREALDLLPEILKDKGTDDACRERLAKRYAELLSLAGPDHAQCKKAPTVCQTRKEQVTKVAAELSSLGLAPYLSSRQEKQVAEGCVENWDAFSEKMRKFYEPVDDASKCINPKVGESRPVITDADVGAGYLLNRKSEHKYEAVIDIDFDLSALSSGSGVTDESMRKKVNDCLKRSSGHLTGPKDKGTQDQLSIRLAKPGAEKGVPKISIGVVSAVSRERMNTWGAESTCETITHEMLHILGQVDEYDRPTGDYIKLDGTSVDVGKNPAYNDFVCRAVAPTDSVMNDADQAFQAIEGYTEERRCACAKGDAKCAKVMDGLSGVPDKCPAGTLNLSKRPGGDFGLKGGETYIILKPRKVPPTRKSLLYPAQFKDIIMPGCKSANKIFLACKKDAYRKTHGHCPLDRPKECSDGSAAFLDDYKGSGK